MHGTRAEAGFSLSRTFLISEVVVAPTGAWTSLPLAIQPAWMGLQLYSQYFASDANLVLSSSNGLKLTIGSTDARRRAHAMITSPPPRS